jgi:hypothetical protein
VLRYLHCTIGGWNVDLRFEEAREAFCLINEEGLRVFRSQSGCEVRSYESQSFDFDPLKDINIQITDGEKYEEAISRAQQMRSEQEVETATLGRTFARGANGADAFSKL